VPGEDVYFRGAVRMGVSTERIRAELVNARNSLILVAGIIALVAAGLGLVGAFIMAWYISTPIKKLAAGVAVIRDTEDQKELEGHVIDISTKDEIGMLATTVNQMIQALVKAAIAREDLMLGKDIQKMFIPLKIDVKGRKGTTGGEQNENIEFYGYYEGAKGVSGDYFEYRKLKDPYYAVIKCDVSGKGVPAALIMVEVATIFSTWFRGWAPDDPGLDKTNQLVDLIHDMLEEREFKGKFAAFTLAIINSNNGTVYFTHAGDKDQHVFRASLGRMVKIELPGAPAAGAISRELLDMGEGFKTVKQKLQTGDILFLFTDGIEEAKRTFRNEQFQPITCDEPSIGENEEHGGTHLKGSENEELGIPRIYEIINAVFSRKIFQLVKYHNPLPNEELTFDFTSCEGSVAEAVLAMVAVEKIFRLNPDPSAGAEDRIDVDKNIHEFLKKHFVQFDRYFRSPLAAEEESDVVTYSLLKEDDQYDDLTILAIRKK